ncbi:hypothetical protein ACOI22_02120 [Glaciecola sp. 2405UD65-10]|uniref:hypothetical protein n=1 Tax=Glaciecola sp. 2405UD65-10 TaxID=3397244 RepID=UPI003B5CA9A9
MGIFTVAHTVTSHHKVNLLTDASVDTANHFYDFNNGAKHTSVQDARWHCNISQHFSFSSLSSQQIQVKATEKMNQFDLLCALLKAGNCSRIYIDLILSDKQQDIIRPLQQLGGTEIINARLVHMFGNMSSIKVS